ncbi:MAG: hypothetical protein R2765_13180 [Ferruginibacter sp.]
MQNLFFVTVAAGILSATSLTAKAQPSVNIEQLNAGAKQKSQIFKGIEINAVLVHEKNVEIHRYSKYRTPNTSAIEKLHILTV